ncbi:MAG: hypothetical protein ABJA66_02065 [Actinomycetota bacterium]
MKKILIIAVLIFVGLNANGFAQKQQKYRKISEMITDSQRVGGLLAGLLGGNSAASGNLETTSLSAVNFPNSVKVKYTGETRKISKPRKKAVDTWLKEYAKQSDARKFYVNEIEVEENGVRYWIMAHENNVIAKLKSSAKKNDEVVLKLKILGYSKKGDTTDYFLLSDSVE